MRCKPIRTVFRAALAAGILATCHNAPLSASWKDYLHPSADACFLHDHHWENFNSASKAAEHFAKSIVKSDAEIRLVADQETEACVAAAKRFELKSQVDAVLASLRSKAHKLSEASAKLFMGYSQSRRLVISTIESRSLMLVDWIKTPDMLPVSVIESDKGNAFECDWDCGDWRRDIQNSVSVSPPPRDLANVFVYILEAANNSHNAHNSYESYEINDTNASYDSETDSSEFPSQDSLASNSEIARDSEAPIAFAHAWQVGVDPICPEVQVCNPTWHGVGSEPSICCPIERTEEAIVTETDVPPAVIAIRPPTLEAELASSASNAIDETGEFTAHSFDGFSSPWCDSLNWSPWSSRIGKRFAFGDNAPRMPEAGPAIAAYSKEDLESASTYASKILEELQNGYQQLDEADSSEIKFSSKDFLITHHDSAYGSILLPDHATNVLAKPTVESKTRVSKNFASPIRTVGQFLVDFANQIENQVEQIEFAKRENNQR